MAARKKVTGVDGGGVGERLADIARALEAMISGDLECQLPMSPAQDELDAICYGVNVLVGELGFVTANLRRARAEAEAANAAKSTFLRAASHELRTPLSVIVWLAELVKDPSQVPADRLESFLTGIHRSARELLHTTEAILDLSRLEDSAQPSLEVTDVIDTVRDALTTLQPLADRKGIALCLAREPGAPDVVMTCAQHLRQVIINLVANSIKFSSGGDIVVRIRRVDVRVAIDVQDSGVGIPADMHARIFEPFFQVDRTAARELGGAGLGLALARGLAESLEGTLDLLTSAEGVGSTFRVTIPMRLPPGADVSARCDEQRLPSVHGQPRPLEGLRVLVADDEGAVRDTLCQLLETAGASAGQAADGEEAVAKALDGDFAMVLMDVRMPVIDGLAATRRLRAAGFRRPILALTANQAPEQRAACLAAGCDDHYVKPIASSELIARLVDLTRAAAAAVTGVASRRA